MLETRTLLSGDALSWVPVGPNPVQNAQNVLGPPPATAANTQQEGAINSLAVDPLNSKHVFAATVNGGIWQTDDFTVANPQWTTTTDQMPSLAISTIAISPVNPGGKSSTEVIYAGTGSFSAAYSNYPAGNGAALGDPNNPYFAAGLGGGAVGVYKSTDGGATWQVLNPGGMFTNLPIARIIPTTLNGGNTVFLATQEVLPKTGTVTAGGVYRSTDGGVSWARLSGPTDGLPMRLPNSGVTDLVENPNNPNQFFAAIPGVLSPFAGIYESDDAGVSWTNVSGGATGISPPDVAASARIQLAISPARANPLWAAVINTTGYYQRVYRGVPGGGTVAWTAIGPPGGTGPEPPDIFGANNQGITHGAIAADPTSDTLVYLGGDINSATGVGYIVRGDAAAATPAGIWTALVPVGPPPVMSQHPGSTAVPTDNGDTSAPHPDSRTLVFAGTVMLLGCDGGVYECSNPNSVAAGAQVWRSINGTLQDTEVYQVSLDNRNTATPADDLIEAAAQDNSASERDATGTWTAQTGGDGNNVFADPTTDTRYFASNAYAMETVTGAGTVAFPKGLVTGTFAVPGGPAEPLNQFIAGPWADKIPNSPHTFVINQGDVATGLKPAARILLAGTGKAGPTLYLSKDMGAKYTSIGTPVSGVPAAVAGLGGGPILTMAFGSAGNTNVCYVGTADVGTGAGEIAMTTDITQSGGGFSVTNFKMQTGGTAVGAEQPQDMIIDPNDPNTLYVVTLTRVLMTNDAGKNWVDLTGNLGSLVAPNFSTFGGAFQRSIALFTNGTPTKADDVLLVGFPGGVFKRSALPGSHLGSTWSPLGANLPQTLVTSLQYDAQSDTLVAGTFGRGVWKLSNLSSALGSLDAAFAGGGRTLLPLPAGWSQQGQVAEAVAIQKDGKIVVATAPANAPPQDIALFRLNPDGTPDGNFGTGGEVTIDFTNVTGGGGSPQARVDALTIDANGNILVAGTVTVAFAATMTTGPEVFLTRVTSTGTVDTTFAPPAYGGRFIFASGPIGAAPGTDVRGMAIDSSGNILVAVEAFFPTPAPNFPSGQSYWVIFRLTSDGMLTPWSSNPASAFVTIADPFPNTIIDLSGMAIDSQGLIDLVGSDIPDGATFGSLMVAQLTPAGTLNPAFGDPATPGIALRQFRANPSLSEGMTIDAQDRIVIDGIISDGGGDDGVVTRLTSTGQTDSTFGSGGSSTAVSFSGLTLNIGAVALDPVGNIVVSSNDPDLLGLATIRFTDTGRLDTLYAFDGATFAAVSDLVGGNALTALAGHLAIDGQGNVILAGDVGNASQPHNALVVRIKGGVAGLALVKGGMLKLDASALGPGPHSISIGTTPSGGVQVMVDSETQTFDPGQVTSLDVVAGSGTNTIDLQAVASGLTSITVHGAGTTTLEAPSGVTDVWHNTGMGSGTLDVGTHVGLVTYSGITNEMGGGTDDFKFEGGSVPGFIDGGPGPGKASLDYAALAGPITVSLQTDTAADVGGTFRNINDFIGSAGLDTLQGPDGSSTWVISGPNQGMINGLTFSSFENVSGGIGNSLFTLQVGGSIAGTIAGGLGTSTLAGPPQGLTWNIQGLNQGNLPAVVGAFQNIANLSGGPLQDIFVFAASGRLTGVIDGNGGGDFLNYSAKRSPVIVNLATGTARYTGGISNIQNVIGSAHGGDTLIGNALGNILVGHKKGNHITAGSGPSLLIGGFGKNTLRGGGAGDILIAGRTVYDADPAALTDILTQWQAQNGSRASYLSTIVGLRGGADPLILGRTVFVPAQVAGPLWGRGGGSQQSTLFGGGGLDWYFTQYPFAIVDLQVGQEQIA